MTLEKNLTFLKLTTGQEIATEEKNVTIKEDATGDVYDIHKGAHNGTG